MVKLINFKNNKFFFIIVIFLIISLYLALEFFFKKNGFLIFLFIFLFIIILVEILFRSFYKLIKKNSYNFIEKIPFSKIYIKSHPYLSYVCKKNFRQEGYNKIVNYPLKKVLINNLTSNNLGFFNGPDGSRNVQIPKPQNLIRINCLGASTTGNYISQNKTNYSYPLILENILRKKYKIKIEVNNFGQGGYNSADLLIRYLLQIVDTKPDYLIIYHAYNDIRSYLTPGFMPDYSHSRRNIGERIWRFSLNEIIPDIPLKLYNYLKTKYIVGDVRNSLLDLVSKGDINTKLDFSLGLKVYERNMQNIIYLAKKNNTKVILCTFAIFLYNKLKKDPLHILYKKIVEKENQIIKDLSKKNKTQLVDCDLLIPRKKEYFLDTIHFSIEGMKILAKLIAASIRI